MSKKELFYEADILLPKFYKDKASMEKYAVIACDQFTSEPEYWEEAKRIVGDSPSSLDLILPEAYLDKTDSETENIHRKMKEYSEDLLIPAPAKMIYCERTLPSNGKIRRGIIGCIDLEDYEYSKGSKALIRSSEATVMERIPPRVKIRRGAELELPHVMLFYDDESSGLNNYLIGSKRDFKKLYDFNLMQGSGRIKGYAIDDNGIGFIKSYLNDNCIKNGLLFTVGDGNHSLASAKAYYEEMKAKHGSDILCRYALVEIVNIHDEAIRFEPIYRLIKDITPKEFVNNLANCRNISYYPSQKCFRYNIVSNSVVTTLYINNPTSSLPVGEIQRFIDEAGYKTDYIHGIDSVRKVTRGNNTGIMFEGMKKSELFSTVISEGELPRKTFSMGEAKDKRFYLEARKIL